MDHESLRTAATYINNLLLARGLLRNGEPIDFVKPSRDSRAQIINLVHDLVLREDRGREEREHVAITLRDLRADHARKTEELSRLKEKYEGSMRAATQAQVAERTAQADLKKAERSLKTLQDQSSKLKASVGQMKAQCANDVRRRDLELARLKSHLQVQQRGNRAAVTAPSMVMVKSADGRPTVRAPSQNLADPEYSLKQETTEFLTQLSQSLSDENDSLITLVRESLSTVNQLLGISTTDELGHADSAIGSMHGSRDKRDQETSQSVPQSYELLTHEMQSSMAQLKDVLSNPNFVNIEEVEIREEEIHRLRQGWEHMEKRWRDVLIMMDGWLERINTGQSIDVEDLRRGMGLVSPVHFRRTMHVDTVPSLEPSMVEDESSEIRLPDVDTADSSLVLGPPRLISLEVQTLARRNSAKKLRTQDILRPPVNFEPPLTASLTSPEHAIDLAESRDELQGIGIEHDGPDLTVAEKLEAARLDAEQAVVKGDTMPVVESEEAAQSATTSKRQVDESNEAREAGQVRKRKITVGGRIRPRKSTLTPAELRELLASNTR